MPVIQSENLDQKAYQIVKEMIENRVLKPGQKIPQEKLAAELGISRTPLISALKFLEQEKLVVTQPRRGFYVRLFSLEELVSIFEIREVLEGLSARRAAKTITVQQMKRLKMIFQPFADAADITDFEMYSRADRQFHNFIAQISSKEFLSSILRTFNIVSLTYLYPSKEGLIRTPNETIKEHLAIVEAICSHEPEAAENRMRQHLKMSAAKLVKEIDKDKNLSKEVANLKDDFDAAGSFSN